MNEDLRVIDGNSDFHIFKSGERVEILHEFPKEKYWVKANDGREDVVLEEHLRHYDAHDEYDDMYCDKCGGTACMC